MLFIHHYYYFLLLFFDTHTYDIVQGTMEGNEVSGEAIFWVILYFSRLPFEIYSGVGSIFYSTSYKKEVICSAAARIWDKRCTLSCGSSYRTSATLRQWLKNLSH